MLPENGLLILTLVLHRVSRNGVHHNDAKALGVGIISVMIDIEAASKPKGENAGSAHVAGSFRVVVRRV
jgi:hypothetical protein